MTDVNPEPDLPEDSNVQREAIDEALNALSDVKAYTLTPEELKDFKAAHYALRNLHPDVGGWENVAGVYDG